MPEVGEKVFSFESFTLDLTRGCLRGEDGEVELRPKSFEVLRYLVENAGRFVSKDELIRADRPDVIVTDDSLTRCVSDAGRGALCTALRLRRKRRGQARF